MKMLPQILPNFEEIHLLTEIKLLTDNDTNLKFQPNCAYLLEEGNSISKFIEKIGKQAERSNEVLNLYDFYTAYNIKFPTIPATVSLIDEKRLVAMGICDFEELLQKICANSKKNSPLAVFLSIEARTPEEMLKIKRNILQQFIFLRMYLPIIVSENFKSAVETFNEILNSTPNEKTDITLIGTKKSGKSSLINAILGAEYTPSSSELPTPNVISYEWSGEGNNLLGVVSEGKRKIFGNVEELNKYLTREFIRANKNAAALKPMQIYVPKFPENLRDFKIADTPGPNFAGSKEHTAVTENTLQDIKHCIFIMNYSAHLTNDEIALFDKVYKVLNNKRRHQTMIVAVNRIDEMYSAEVIKSYERFADYILNRLNALGYENIVVVSISAITSVYIEKVKKLLAADNADSLDKQLKKLHREYKGTDQETAISFVEKSLDTLFDFHGKEFENLEQLKQTSRVNYLVEVAASMYDPAEQFEWIDETFEDVLDADFENDEEFFARVLEYAEQENPDAMEFVAELYYFGHGVNEDENKAFEWFQRAAAAGNPNGMNNLADCYRRGIGTAKNIQKAVEWYEKAARADNADSMVALGAMYFKGEGVNKNEVEAFNLNLKAAELGNLVAMNNVAYQYKNGAGVSKNLAKAAEWYMKASDSGDANAIFELARIYELGEGVTKNLKRAAELFRKSADAGNANAMVALGAMYFRGEGINKNEVEAFNLNLKAAELDDLIAMGNVAYQYRTGVGVNKNLAKAAEWYMKASDGGNFSATCELAEMYNEGEGLTKDKDRALELYKKASAADFEEAFQPLAKIYYSRQNYKKAFEYFSKAAEKDYIVSMIYLGIMYELGQGVEENPAKSFEWFKKAADKDNSFAMTKVAEDYAAGYGVAENFNEAAFWYEKALEAGDEDAVEPLADLYYRNEFFSKALKFYKKGAENGNAHCMNRIGVMYAKGRGVNQDEYEAVRWYRKAAEGDFAWAMYNLGMCYYNGKGVAKNLDEAARLLKKAAENGIENAFEKLGDIYDNLEKYSDAFAWYKKAAEKGNARCINYIGAMYAKGRGVNQDEYEAVRWYRRAMEAGNVWGMYNLGMCYYHAKGVAKNLNEAVRLLKKAAENGIDDAFEEIGAIYYSLEEYTDAFAWYKKGAENGNARCMNRIGVMYENGNGVKQNENEAAYWYRRAIDAGSVWAMYNLGMCYYHGNGVAEDNEKAFDLFYKAAKQGNSDAMIMLGQMYRYGYHVSKDYDMACDWYRKARDAGNSEAQSYIDKVNEERRSSSSSGGCFITTAVCLSLGKPDDCYELTTFRNFRDSWLIYQPDGKNLIAQYYKIAPSIVAKIDSLNNFAQIYNLIWQKYLKPCLKFIERGENQSCKRLYINMVKMLDKKFLR